MGDCQRSEADARKDGQRLGQLLHDGDQNFLTFIDKEYGTKALTACPKLGYSLKPFMEELKKINSQYVQIDLPSVPDMEIGHYNGGYFMPDNSIKGYRINLTNLLVTEAIDELRTGASPAKVNAMVARSVNGQDAEMFANLLKERMSTEKLPFDVTLDDVKNIMIKKAPPA